MEKWHGTEEQADRVHGMAASAVPLVARIPPMTFLKALALAEISMRRRIVTPLGQGWGPGKGPAVSDPS